MYAEFRVYTRLTGEQHEEHNQASSAQEKLSCLLRNQGYTSPLNLIPTT